jgi:hypothetical protein
MNADNPAAAGVKRSRARTRYMWMVAVNRSPDLSPVERAVAISIGLHFNISTAAAILATMPSPRAPRTSAAQ